jgi:small-conductance mechanosensitive channel
VSQRICVRLAAVLAVIAMGTVVPVAAQGAQPLGIDAAQVSAAATLGQPALLRYNNRQITVLRATVLSRPPAERAAAVVELLDRMVRTEIPGPVTSRQVGLISVVSVGKRDVFAIFPMDVNPLVGETPEGNAAEAVARLQQALNEAVELKTPRRMLVSTASALAATVLFGLLLWVMSRGHRVLSVRLPGGAERHLQRLSGGDIQLVRALHARDLFKHAVTALFGAVAALVAYAWLTFVLRRFPYTRPWGESLRSFLVDRAGTLGSSFVSALPNLFTALLILLVTRVAVRGFQAMFLAVEGGRLTIPYVHPETAVPTRRIVATLTWLLGIVLAYPYLPGSGSDAFKGISVFIGLVVSLGSSGIVNQMMSGLTITYSRAVHVDDFVKIGDVEGTITQLGPLSTKVKTPRGEELTIPNALMISQATTNYSRYAATEGVFVPTSVTIGYDAPWRQVQALLLLAAERTPGIRPSPKPVVRLTSLEDFYVHYTLLVCLEQPFRRSAVLAVLHGNILDAFNEFGVQITSPHYEGDPRDRKVVPQDQWYAAPAKPPTQASS